MRYFQCLFALLIFWASACQNISDNTGQDSVAQFRGRVKRGEFQQIVDDASAEFRHALVGSTRRNFKAKLLEFQQEIGNGSNFEWTDREVRYDIANEIAALEGVSGQFKKYLKKANRPDDEASAFINSWLNSNCDINAGVKSWDNVLKLIGAN